MIYADGFYKYDNELFYAKYFVRGQNYELNINDRMSYNYPVQGWYWFDSLEEACLFFNINIDVYKSSDSNSVSMNSD